mgnify:CR=1 FL=1
MLDRLVGGVVLVRAESGEYVSGAEIKDGMFVYEGDALCLRREVVLIALEPAQVVAIEIYDRDFEKLLEFNTIGRFICRGDSLSLI